MTTPETVELALRLGTVLGSAARPTALSAELAAAATAVRAVFGAAACSVALLEDDGESLRFVAADGVGAASITGTALPVARGIAGWVATTGQPIVVADVRADPRFARDVAESTQYVPASIMAAPLLRRDGEVLGVIEVLDRAEGGTGTGRDLDLLGVLASQLASVVDVVARYDRLGAMVVAGLTGADDAEVVDRIVAAAGEEDRDLTEVAGAVARLSAMGPRGRRLVQRIVEAVADHAADRR